MNQKSGLDLFVRIILPSIILAFGLGGNLLGFIVFMRPRLKNIGPTFTFKLMFSVDTFYLFQIIGTCLENSDNYYITKQSEFSCKLWNYFNYSLSVVSPWLMCYISVEKLISCKYSTHKAILRKKEYQFIYFIIICSISLIFYTPVYLYYEINSKGICDFNNRTHMIIINLMDIIYRLIVPLFLMATCVTIEITTVFNSRNKIENHQSITKKSFKKRDLKWSLYTIVVLVIYLILYLPFAVFIFLPEYYFNSKIEYVLSFYIFYSIYACKFYVYICINSLFRREFLKLFKLSN